MKKLLLAILTFLDRLSTPTATILVLVWLFLHPLVFLGVALFILVVALNVIAISIHRGSHRG